MSGWLSDKGWGGDLASPGPIGNVTPSTGAFTTLSATTSVTSPIVKADGSGGGVLQSSNGTQCMQWGGGGGANVTIDGGLSAAASVTLQTGTANGVLYLNGSKAATTYNKFWFDGTNLVIGNTANGYNAQFMCFGGNGIFAYSTGTALTGQQGAHVLRADSATVPTLEIENEAATGYMIKFTTNGGSVCGSISFTPSATAYNTGSDYRLKNIESKLENSGNYIDALNPVRGTWKADDSVFIGLIAHEVQEISETLIATGVKDGDEMQAMNYASPEIIANIIAELQSIRKRLNKAGL